MQAQLTNSLHHLRSKFMLLLYVFLIQILLPNANASSPDGSEGFLEITSGGTASTFEITISKIHVREYSKFSPPAASNGIVKVKVEISLHQIKPSTEKKNIIEVSGDLIQTWQDKRLQWNQSESKYTSQIPFSRSSVWTPKLTVNDERVSSVATVMYNENDLLVSSGGMVTWVQSISIRCVCYLTEALLKQSTFTCDLNIRPERRGQHDIRIILKRSYYTHSIRVLDRNWKINRIEYYPGSTDGPQLPIQYQNKRITLHMVKIHSHLYPNTLLLIVISTFLIIVSFFLSPQMGYLKLSIPIAFLLIICIYTIMQGKLEMRISETLFDEYCIAAMTAICLFTVMMQCFTLKLWHRNPTVRPGFLISYFYLKVPIGVGRFFCSCFHFCCGTSWRPWRRVVKMNSNEAGRTSQMNGDCDEWSNDSKQGRQTDHEAKYPRGLQRYGAVYKTISAYEFDPNEIIFTEKWRKAARINDRFGILIVVFAVSTLTIQWLKSHHALS